MQFIDSPQVFLYTNAIQNKKIKGVNYEQKEKNYHKFCFGWNSANWRNFDYNFGYYQKI